MGLGGANKIVNCDDEIEKKNWKKKFDEIAGHWNFSNFFHIFKEIWKKIRNLKKKSEIWKKNKKF